MISATLMLFQMVPNLHVFKQDLLVGFTIFEDIGFRNAFIPLRAYPGIERSSKEWENTYKIRVNVENSINHSKIVATLRIVRPRIRKRFMLIYFLPESPSLLL